MFKKFLLWTVGFILLNILFIACGTVKKELVDPTPQNELLALQNDSQVVSFQNSYQGRCVDNANSYVKQFCDSDNDGLLNVQEFEFKTDIYNIDSDNDGYTDYEEVERAFDPLSFEDLVPEKYKYCEESNRAWCWKAQAYYKADPEICEHLLEEKSSNSLFFSGNSNNNQGEYDDCVEEAQVARDKINKELAIADWNLEVCNKINDEKIKEECEKELALISGALNMDKDYCLESYGFSKIKKDENVTHKRELQHRCWFGMAIATEDVEQCSHLDKHVIKDFDAVACVTKIARLKNDKDICNSLKDMGLSTAIPRCLGESKLPSNDK